MIFLSKLIGLRANRIQLLKLSGFQKLPEESLKEYQTQIVILLLVTLVTRKVVSRILINCARMRLYRMEMRLICAILDNNEDGFRSRTIVYHKSYLHMPWENTLFATSDVYALLGYILN